MNEFQTNLNRIMAAAVVNQRFRQTLSPDYCQMLVPLSESSPLL